MQTFTKVFLALFTILTLVHLKSIAQKDSAYVVRLGTFVGADHDDFKDLGKIGFVHAENQPNNYQQISLGSYYQVENAARALERVRQSGYPDAYIQGLDLAKAKKVAGVQLAVFTVGNQVDWPRFFSLGYPVYAIQEDYALRVLTSGFSNQEELNAALVDLKAKGFKEAFVKQLPANMIHEVGMFETGLDPASFQAAQVMEEKEKKQPEKGEDNQEQQAGNSLQVEPTEPIKVEKKIVKKEAPAYTLPKERPVRTDVKRTAALELQKVLKSKGAYAGSLDGFYGEGTAKGFEVYTSTNSNWKKYEFLAENYSKENKDTALDPLQKAINELETKPDFALNFLEEKEDNPLALAYRTYYQFTHSGPSQVGNEWMNKAIQLAFADAKKDQKLAIDPSATYAYNDYPQLVDHLMAINKEIGDYSVPCWFVQRHQKIIFEKASGVKVEACDQFDNWQIVKTLKVIAKDMSVDASPEVLKEAAQKRSWYYLAPRPLAAEEKEQVEGWYQKLWAGLDGWAGLDPTHQQSVSALRVAFFQTQIQLEEYYMDKQLNPAEAKMLALATLKTMVGEYLARFV